MQRNKGNKARNILITRFSALGDIAMTIPTIYNACRANPERHFFFLTRPHPSALFINAPKNLTIVGADLSNYKGAAGLWELASSLKERYKIDYFIDLHDVLRTKLLRAFMALKGVGSVRINKGRIEKRKLTRRKDKHLIPLKTTAERYDDAFRQAGITLDNSFKSIFTGTPDGKGDPKEFAALAPQKKEGEHWLAIAPFAKHRGKIYPLELLERVVEHFNSKPGERIFIFGFGKNEEAAIEALAAKYPSVVNMAKARLGIPAELSLLSHCDTMLSMDSFNMHLASLVGLRTVSVWGATHPYTGFMGRGQSPEDAVQLDMTCRPCSVFGDKPCFRGDYHCLWGITPRVIIDKIEKDN
ncbi:MAG: glycosyltransferase family 9 protein [Muribaculaceae bacterium]|nr:glycosyltransferase family 9 protein [Muribaculaceae bacterium]